jgi:hypothetical protein
MKQQVQHMSLEIVNSSCNQLYLEEPYVFVSALFAFDFKLTSSLFHNLLIENGYVNLARCDN